MQIDVTKRELEMLIEAITEYYDLDFQHHTEQEYVQLKEKLVKATNTVKCVDCGRELNPVEALFSEKSHRCGDCIRKLHKETIGR